MVDFKFPTYKALDLFMLLSLEAIDKLSSVFE